MQPTVSQSESRFLYTGGNMQITKQENQTLFSVRKIKLLSERKNQEKFDIYKFSRKNRSKNTFCYY